MNLKNCTMLEDDREVALTLAEKALKNSDLDMLLATVGLRYLCRAKLYNKGYTQQQAKQAFDSFAKLPAADGE